MPTTDSLLGNQANILKMQQLHFKCKCLITLLVHSGKQRNDVVVHRLLLYFASGNAIVSVGLQFI